MCIEVGGRGCTEEFLRGPRTFTSEAGMFASVRASRLVCGVNQRTFPDLWGCSRVSVVRLLFFCVGLRGSSGPLCHREEVGNVVLPFSDGYHTCTKASRGTAEVAEPVEAEQPHAGHRVAPSPGSTGQRLIASVSIYLHSFVCAFARNFRALGSSAIDHWWNVWGDFGGDGGLSLKWTIPSLLNSTQVCLLLFFVFIKVPYPAKCTSAVFSNNHQGLRPVSIQTCGRSSKALVLAGGCKQRVKPAAFCTSGEDLFFFYEGFRSGQISQTTTSKYWSSNLEDL